MERKKDVTQENGFNNQQPIVTVEINHSNKTRKEKNTKKFIPFSSKQLWTIGILLVLAVGAWIIPSVIDNSSRDEEAIQPIETVNEEVNTASDEPISATSSRPINHTDFNDVNFSEENKSDIKTNSRPKSTIPQFSHNNIKLQSPKVQQHIENNECSNDSSNTEATQNTNIDTDQFKWLSEQKFSEHDFLEMAPNHVTLRIWCNSIFARHGYIFKSQEMSDYFSQFDWYTPQSTNVEKELSDIERENARILRELYDRT